MYYYPSGRTASTYTVPKGVIEFQVAAFEDVKGKLTVKLPPTVKSIIYEFFDDYDDKPFASLENLTFMVKKGSRSHKTVKKMGYKYKFYK